MATVVERKDPPATDARPATERPEWRGGAGLLWYGMLGPPLLMLLNLELAYMMTPWACRTGMEGAMHAVTACILALDILAGLGAASRLRHDWIEDKVITRPFYMAMLGILLSSLFGAVIVAQWMPHAYLSPCQ